MLAIWRVKGTNSNESGKTVLTPPEKILTASHAALIGESPATPFLNTVLMSWWSKIDYFRWEVGFKRAVLVEMLAGFMVEVTDRCSVAGIIVYRVELNSGARLMAEACLAPSIALPLSVTRYDTTRDLVNFQAELLCYQKRN